MYPRVPKKRCPNCGSTDYAEIIYGMHISPGMDDALEKGRITMGGCCIGPDAPRWECNKCSEGFGEYPGYNRWRDPTFDDPMFEIKPSG